MSLKEDQISNLKRVVEVLSKFDGVAGILLFGSYARGDYDEHSDYDLLVIFEDKTSMWNSWKDLFRAVGNLKMNLHVIPETVVGFIDFHPFLLTSIVRGSLKTFGGNGKAPHIGCFEAMFQAATRCLSA